MTSRLKLYSAAMSIFYKQKLRGWYREIWRLQQDSNRARRLLLGVMQSRRWREEETELEIDDLALSLRAAPLVSWRARKRASNSLFGAFFSLPGRERLSSCGLFAHNFSGAPAAGEHLAASW